MERVKAKTPDDERREVGDAAAGDVGHESKESEEPCLVVEVSLLDLAPIDLALFDTRLIATDTCNHDKFLIVTKTPDGPGGIW